MPIYRLDDISPDVPDDGRWWLAPDASIIGRVVIGEDVGIWFGAVLRGDNEPITIGPRTNIQEHAMLHTDPGFPLTVGKGCTIGHRAIIHGCTIGHNTLIGMGAVIMNGVEIGDNCLIGAGALVTERSVIPDNSLAVGAPARVIRKLDGASAEQLRQSAEHYVTNAGRFARGLTRID
jgi:carbonic anhydrase/acetyltransferase-like protein (isoleucine patch superfamily)